MFPPVSEAEPDGLLAVGGDLRPERLLLAYASGIFPWYDESMPILWFSPETRAILSPDRLHAGRSVAKALRRSSWNLSMDTGFESVVEACSTTPRPDQDGTWITADMRQAYVALHKLGFAHSVEVRNGDRLVGGLYGVSLGSAFFGESMFSVEPGASRIAFVWLARQLEVWGFTLIDCQNQAPHLARLGACEVPRAEFLVELEAALLGPTRQGAWRFDANFRPRDLEIES